MQYQERCNLGKLQITDDGKLQVQQFNKVLWSIPCSEVTGIVAQDGPMMSKKLAISSSSQDTKFVEMVTKANYQKLLAFFQGLQSQEIHGYCQLGNRAEHYARIAS